MQDWIRQHKDKGIQPVISNPSRQVMRLLEKAHIPQLIGEEYITVRVNDAVLLCRVHIFLSVAVCCITISALCSCHMLGLHHCVHWQWSIDSSHVPIPAQDSPCR